MTDVWARKSVVDLLAEAAHTGVGSEVQPLRRALSATNLVGLGVGGIVGAGIFVLTGHAAAANAGPAVTLSFLLGAVACAFAGLCYAEMASTVPISGSAYTYAYATMGELIAWIIGWDLILEYAIGAGTVAMDGRPMSSASPGFRHQHPRAICVRAAAFDAASHTWSTTGAILNVPAIAIVAGDHDAAGDRHQGIRPAERHHCRDQADRHRAVCCVCRTRLFVLELGDRLQSGRTFHST